MYEYDPPILELGQKYCSVCKEVFLYFSKMKSSESNSALGYDIASGNVLTNILNILRCSPILTAAKGLSNILSPSSVPSPRHILFLNGILCFT